MSYETILYETKGAIATITLNRPERLNAVNAQLVEDVCQAIEEVRIDDGLRALVVKGAGRAFCAGDDLLRGEEHTGPRDFQTTLRRRYPRIVLELLTLRKPVVAAVHGYAVGAGLDIALACDFRIATEDTQMAAIFVKRGLGGGCCYLLPRYVGLGKATELLFTGDFIDAREAERLGLVNRVVPREALESTVQEWAERFAKGPTKSYALIKTARNRGLGEDPSKGLEWQAMGNWELALIEYDSDEGARAWREKREPRFEGR